MAQDLPSRKTMSKLGRALMTVWLVGAAGAATVSAQDYSASERVTVIDLPVEFRRGRVMRDPAVSDVDLRVDGRSRSIVALGPVPADDLQPYQVLIYLDSELTDRHHRRESADLLLEVRNEMLSLGAVDVVIADPEPQFVLRDCSDPERLQSLLVGPTWRGSSGDAIRALRSSFLESMADPEEESSPHELAGAYLIEERALVQRRLDALVDFLSRAGTPGKLKVLVPVGLRFDLDPMDFYGAWIGSSAESTADALSSGAELLAPAVEAAKTITAYGWVTLPAAPPEPEGPLVPGLRLGKWRLAGPAGGRIIGIKLSRESERDPELATSYLEKGEALLGQNEPLEAKEAFEKALHHFYGDPKTAQLQARALLGLSAALEALGDDEGARTTTSIASEVDAETVAQAGEPLSMLLDPQASVQILARESSGRAFQEAADLRSAFEDLSRRTRVSFQLVGEPSGEVYSVEVRPTPPGLAAATPLWVRFGTPDEVAAARVRLFMAGEPLEPSHGLDGRLVHGDQEGEAARLDLRLEVSAVDLERPDEEQACRMTVGTRAPQETSLQIEHLRVVCEPTDSGLVVAAPWAAGAEFATVHLEHLGSGSWGIQVFELEETL